jgi:chromosomal replication initiation ATPase DnaA
VSVVFGLTELRASLAEDLAAHERRVEEITGWIAELDTICAVARDDHEAKFRRALEAVAFEFDVPRIEILSANRSAAVSEARFALYLISRERGIAIEKIARLTGRSGHYSVQHGMRRCAQLIETDEIYHRKVKRARVGAIVGVQTLQ